MDNARAGGDDVTSSETLVEITYQAKITPWLTLQPDLQFIFNPHEGDGDAVVFGIRMESAF